MSQQPCPIQHHAARQPEAPALVLPHTCVSYAEYDAAIAAAAARLQEAGVQRSDTVALALSPGLPALVLLPALFRIGAVAFPLNPRFPTAYLQAQVTRFTRTLIVPADAVLATGGGALQVLTVKSLLSETGSAPSGECALDLDAPATMILTSGSTGTPKAAVHTYGNHHHNALRSNANLPLGPGDRWLLSLPLHHVAGIGVLFRTTRAGAAMIIPAPGEDLADSITRYHATHVSLVATQLYRLLQQPEGPAALAACKAILLGGSAIPEALLREAHAAGLPLLTSYGMTEMATQVTTTAPGDGLDALLTAGRPLVEGSLRIAPGGEIQVRGDTLFLGYAEESGLRRPLTQDGWFATGDLGTLDDAGRLRVHGRKDNLFIAGGENVQPEEVESIIGALPEVQRVLVVPVPDPEFGVLPVAFARMADGTPPNTDELRAALSEHLPRFKLPRQFLPWPEDLCPGDEKPQRIAFVQRARTR